jgi:hypothetical protein
VLDAFGEEEAGEGFGALLDFGGGAVGEEVAAVDAGGGSEVDDAVGAFHQLVVVLDDEEGVSFVAEAEERFDEAVVVAGVESYGRLVEDVEDAGEVGAELRGEADALGFAAGEGVGGALEREVAEADVVEEFEALLDLRDDVLGDERAAVVELEGTEAGEELGGGGGEEFGEGDGGKELGARS